MGSICPSLKLIPLFPVQSKSLCKVSCYGDRPFWPVSAAFNLDSSPLNGLMCSSPMATCLCLSGRRSVSWVVGPSFWAPSICRSLIRFLRPFIHLAVYLSFCRPSVRPSVSPSLFPSVMETCMMYPHPSVPLTRPVMHTTTRC